MNTREKVPFAIVEIDEFDEMDEIRIHREGTRVILTKSTNSTNWSEDCIGTCERRYACDIVEIEEFDEMVEI